MTRFTKRSVAVGWLFVCWACGGGSPSAPSVRTTSVTINGSTDFLKMQETVTFTATATRSDGSTAAVSNWTSSAPGVLSINPTTGAATGVSAGQATITATFDGVTGTRSVRVVPQYSGTWSGFYQVTTCSATGDWLLAGWCPLIQSGPLPFGLNLSQTRDTVTGTITFGDFSGNVTGTMVTDGTLTLVGTTTAVTSFGTVSIAITAWNTNSTTVGTMTGSFSQRVTGEGVAGEATHVSNILTASRTATVATFGRDGARDQPLRTLADLARALMGR